MSRNMRQAGRPARPGAAFPVMWPTTGSERAGKGPVAGSLPRMQFPARATACIRAHSVGSRPVVSRRRPEPLNPAPEHGARRPAAGSCPARDPGRNQADPPANPCLPRRRPACPGTVCGSQPVRAGKVFPGSDCARQAAGSGAGRGRNVPAGQQAGQVTCRAATRIDVHGSGSGPGPGDRRRSGQPPAFASALDTDPPPDVVFT